MDNASISLCHFWFSQRPINAIGAVEVPGSYGEKTKAGDPAFRMVDLIRFRLSDSWETSNNSTHSEDEFSGRKETEIVIAIGTNHSFLTVERSGPKTEVFEHKTQSDILAVHTGLPKTILAGARDGAVWLYDLRSRESVRRLKHPSAVTGIRSADEYRVVVAGMQDQVRLCSSRD